MVAAPKRQVRTSARLVRLHLWRLRTASNLARLRSRSKRYRAWGEVCASCALSALSTCPAARAIANARKKCAKSAKSAKSHVLTWRRADFASKTDPLVQNLDEEKVGLRLEPSSTSDKRDDLSARAQRAGGCPVCHPASWPSGLGCLGRVPGGGVFPKLSKLLNQEDA